MFNWGSCYRLLIFYIFLFTAIKRIELPIFVRMNACNSVIIRVRGTKFGIKFAE